MSIGVRRDGVVGALARRTTLPLVALGVLSLVANLLVLTGPLFMLQVYDRVLASRSVPTLVALFALVAATFAFLALIDVIRSRMAARFGVALEASASADVFRVALRQSLTPLGVGRSDPVRDLDTVRQYIGGPGPLALFDLPWLPVYLVIIFLFHPDLGLLATGGALIATTLLVINERLAARPTAEAARAQVARQGFGEDARANAEPIFAMGMLDDVTTRWQARTEAVSAVQANLSKRLSGGQQFLASVGSNAPFIGLFGTVYGIMRSFIGIANTNTTNLAVVAPGIAEALLATGIGLFAAIPSVNL